MMNETHRTPATTADAETQPAPEWIVYQIGGAEPNKYRFIITRGFQDMTVTAALKPFEFIDTTATLFGEFGGDVTVLPDDVNTELLAVARDALTHLNFSTTARADLKKRLRITIAKAEGQQ